VCEGPLKSRSGKRCPANPESFCCGLERTDTGEDSPAESERASEIFPTKARVFGDTRQHAGADFLTIMERENEVGPAFSTQGAV
jgi:hypothetical protein